MEPWGWRKSAWTPVVAGPEEGGKLVEADGFAGELAGGAAALDDVFDCFFGELCGMEQGEHGAGGFRVWGCVDRAAGAGYVIRILHSGGGVGCANHGVVDLAAGEGLGGEAEGRDIGSVCGHRGCCSSDRG